MPLIKLELVKFALYIFIAGATMYSASSFADYSIPLIFNAPLSVRPGDIVGVQGENFGNEPVDRKSVV